MATAYGGGLNKSDFFAVNSVSTGLVKVTALTMVPTTTALTTVADAFLLANQKYSTQVTPVRLNKGMEISIDSDKYSGSVLNAADVYVQGETTTAEYYENAVEAPTLTATGTVPKDAVCITYLRADPDEPTKTTCLITFGNFKEGSGAISLKKGEKIKPKVDFVSKQTTAALTVPAAAFDDTLVTGANTTIPINTEFVRVNLTTV